MTGSAERAGADADTRMVRALLRARASDAAVQDQLDCAALALELGQRDLAAVLYGASFLRLGFSPSAQALFHAANSHHALWTDLGPIGGTASTPGFSVDRAIAELAGLMRIGTPAIAPSTDLGSLALVDGEARREPASAPFAELADRASDLLRQAPPAAADGSLVDLLQALRYDIASVRPIRLEEYLDCSLSVLAALYSLEQVRRFLVANASLLEAETAAPGLFDAVVRLPSNGLGPFFANVKLIIRNARDIFGMIDLASGGHIRRVDMERWCVLLSAHLHRHQLLDLVDELGDRGMTMALGHILARVARADGPHHPADVVWRIRDVCLDIGAWEMAADAQQVIALWRPRDVNEWGILAEIRARLDDSVGVEGALARAALLRPDDVATRKRLAAWRAGGLPPIEGGYGTAPGRRRLRRARLEAYRAAR